MSIQLLKNKFCTGTICYLLHLFCSEQLYSFYSSHIAFWKITSFWHALFCAHCLSCLSQTWAVQFLFVWYLRSSELTCEMCEDSGWLSNATKTAAHWLITALAICFHQDKCQSPAAEHRGSKRRWPSWKPICFVVCSAVRCDQESPAGCRGSRSRDPVGDLLQGWSELCLPHTYRVFLFISGSQAKHHPQPLPQCPPSLKQSNRWLDPDVPYPARFAVVFCFLVMRGHVLEVIPAAPVTPLLAEVVFTCVAAVSVGSQTWHVKIRADFLSWASPCLWEPRHVYVCIFEAVIVVVRARWSSQPFHLNVDFRD